MPGWFAATARTPTGHAARPTIPPKTALAVRVDLDLHEPGERAVVAAAGGTCRVTVSSSPEPFPRATLQAAHAVAVALVGAGAGPDTLAQLVVPFVASST